MWLYGHVNTLALNQGTVNFHGMCAIKFGSPAGPSTAAAWTCLPAAPVRMPDQ